MSLVAALIPHALYDIAIALTACLFATLLAFCLAQSALLWRSASRMFAALAAITQAVPMVAVGPLLVMALGFGVSTKVFIATLICFYPVFVSAIDSANRMINDGEWDARNLGIPSFARFRLVQVPCVVDGISSGLKATFTLSVVGAIISDFVLPTYGLGRVINMARVTYDLDVMYLAVAMSAICGIIFLALGGLSSGLLRGLVRRTG